MPFLIRFGNGKKGKIKGKIYISIKHTWVVRFHKNMTRNGQITTEKTLNPIWFICLYNVIEYLDSRFAGSNFQINRMVENLKILIANPGWIGHWVKS